MRTSSSSLQRRKAITSKVEISPSWEIVVDAGSLQGSKDLDHDMQKRAKGSPLSAPLRLPCSSLMAVKAFFALHCESVNSW
mmetsp:Transcript_12403/g.34139  ORF Transcript_12403/g.34139 Transcript_12403/m.34139 type:complete len:81 (+) Transcript_12403:1251-1493(+)